MVTWEDVVRKYNLDVMVTVKYETPGKILALLQKYGIDTVMEYELYEVENKNIENLLYMLANIDAKYVPNGNKKYEMTAIVGLFFNDVS